MSPSALTLPATVMPMATATDCIVTPAQATRTSNSIISPTGVLGSSTGGRM